MSKLDSSIEDTLLKQIFQVTLNQSESTQYTYLSTLGSQLNALTNVLSSFGGSSSAFLTRGLLDSVLKEKVPCETGLKYLFQSFLRVSNMIKTEKDENKLQLFEICQNKIVEHSKMVLLEQQYYLEQHQDDLYMGSDPNGPMQSELRELFDQLPPTFLDKLLSCCNDSEIQVIFIPVVTEWVVEMGKLCEHGNLLQKQYTPLLKRVSSLVSNQKLISLLSNFLEKEISMALTQTAREMETKSIIASFLGMHTTFNQAVQYFDPKVIPYYPNCTVNELRAAHANLRNCLSEIHNSMHGTLRKIFLSDNKSKEVLLQWISTILDLNELRATANPNDPLYLEMTMICSTEGFLLNLMQILLMFAKPFLDPNGEKKKLISPFYCQFSKRLDYSKQDKLCESSFINLEVDEKLKNGQFGFISDVFFLTYHCLHVALIPSISTYKSRLNLLAQTKQQIQQFQEQYGQDWFSIPAAVNINNSLMRLYPIIDGYDVHLVNPELLNTMLQFSVLAMRWMIDLTKEYKDKEQVLGSMFASFPAYFMKDLLDFIDFTARFHTKTLAQAHLPTMFEFCVTFMNQSQFVKSPLIRARLALILSLFQYLYKQPSITPTSHSWNAPQQQSNQPYILSESEKIIFGHVFVQQSENNIREFLVPGLIRCYLDIGDVEGLDVDKDQIDKYSVRKDIASLLNSLWIQGISVTSIRDILLSNNPEYQSQKFLSTVLSDSIMLLDDSLHRLTDIKTLQEAMELPSWKTQPQDVREKRERYFHGQERSSRAFMSLANAILDFLLNLSRQFREPFIRTPGMVHKLVSMFLWFLGRLCGPQMSALAVKNPEKYGYNPKELLGKIVTIGTCFLESPIFVETIAKDLDYSSELMTKTYSILVANKILPTYECDKFRQFYEKVNSLISSNQKKEEVSLMDVENIVPISDEEAEQKYKEQISQLAVFDECDMKTPEGSFIHHYNDNILKNSSGISRQKMQKISKECALFATDLPISRSSTICIRVDSERMDVMKAIITGPKDTPYSYGVYQFDIFFPPTYPHDPPLVNLETTGNGTVRFNPNLYTDGKVCLSLLGTWHGDQHSKWNPVKSTLIQALISIQGFILCDEPYYNEPSYELQRGTKEGDEASAAYNENINFNNIRYAMIQNLREPPLGFEEVIKKHFLLLRHDILVQCENWISKAKDKAKLTRVVEQLKLELSKLS